MQCPGRRTCEAGFGLQRLTLLQVFGLSDEPAGGLLDRVAYALAWRPCLVYSVNLMHHFTSFRVTLLHLNEASGLVRSQERT